jgi:hypothetical protein
MRRAVEPAVLVVRAAFAASPVALTPGSTAARMYLPWQNKSVGLGV